MKKILIFCLLTLVACQEKEILTPDEPVIPPWQAFYAGQESGDSLLYVDLEPSIIFPGNSIALNDTVFVDTFYMYLDTNIFADFIFIYREEYWYSSTKPTYQCFDVVTPHDVQLPDGENSFGDYIYRCDSGQIIDNSLPWIWELNVNLCTRQNNWSVGASQEYFYIIFNKPWPGGRKYGWIRLKMEFDDYYYKNLIIDGYALKDY